MKEANKLTNLNIDEISLDLPVSEDISGVFDPFTSSDFDESLEKDQINPILVSYIDGAYFCVDGRSRLLSLKKLGKKTVEAKVFSDLKEEADILRIFLETNLYRRQNNFTQKAIKLLIKLKQKKNSHSDDSNPRLNKDDLKKIKLSQTQTGRLSKIEENLSDDFLKKYRTGELSVDLALTISHLPKKVQKDLISTIGNLSDPKSKNRIKDIQKTEAEINNLKESIEALKKSNFKNKEFIVTLEEKFEKKNAEFNNLMESVKKTHIPKPVKHELSPILQNLLKEEKITQDIAQSLQLLPEDQQKKLIAEILSTKKETSDRGILQKYYLTIFESLLSEATKKLGMAASFLSCEISISPFFKDDKNLEEFLIGIHKSHEKFICNTEKYKKEIESLRDMFNNTD